MVLGGGHVSFKVAKNLLLALINNADAKARLNSIQDEQDKLSFLRARGIGVLTKQVADCFIGNEEKLLKGEFYRDLLAFIPSADIVMKIKQVDMEKVYAATEVIEVEVPGFNVLGGLLDAFITASQDVAKNGKKAQSRNSILVKLIPCQFLKMGEGPHQGDYERLLNVTDFICGMTDTYAVRLYKQISGMAF